MLDAGLGCAQDYARLHNFEVIATTAVADHTLDNMWNKVGWLLKAYHVGLQSPHPSLTSSYSFAIWSNEVLQCCPGAVQLTKPSGTPMAWPTDAHMLADQPLVSAVSCRNTLKLSGSCGLIRIR